MNIQKAMQEIYDELRHYGNYIIEINEDNVRCIDYVYSDGTNEKIRCRVALVDGEVAQITIL